MYLNVWMVFEAKASLSMSELSSAWDDEEGKLLKQLEEASNASSFSCLRSLKLLVSPDLRSLMF